MSVPPPGHKITVLDLRQKKLRGERISMLTACDYPTACALDAAEIDILLVGDSLAMVELGHPTTLPVTLEEMLHHARAVARGARRALLVGDLPFLSYQVDRAEAIRNGGRFLKEAGLDAVKLEGGRPFADVVRGLVRAGIPVMGHLGLRPQSVHQLGGFRTQARTAAGASELLADALGLEAAGCFAVVLECVPDRVAAAITSRLTIPTIGIGAGAATDGQVLVSHDLLGLTEQPPRFARRYAQLRQEMERAARAYRRDVLRGSFPAAPESFAISDAEWDGFQIALAATVAR